MHFLPLSEKKLTSISPPCVPAKIYCADTASARMLLSCTMRCASVGTIFAATIDAALLGSAAGRGTVIDGGQRASSNVNVARPDFVAACRVRPERAMTERRARVHRSAERGQVPTHLHNASQRTFNPNSPLPSKLRSHLRIPTHRYRPFRCAAARYEMERKCRRNPFLSLETFRG
jgi:hypothetical protein